MSESVSIPIITQFKPADLQALLENELGEQRAGIQFTAQRHVSADRLVGAEWAALWLVLTSAAKIAPLIFGLIGLLRSGKVKKVRLVANDGSEIEVPHDLSPVLWEELLKSKPQFRELKEVIVD